MGSFDHVALGTSTRIQVAAALNSLEAGNGTLPLYGTTGSSNAYVISGYPHGSSYVNGMTIRAQVNFTNSGAATLNINGWGARDIVTADFQPIIDNNLVLNRTYTLYYYSGSNKFVLLDPSPAWRSWTLTGSTGSSMTWAGLTGPARYIKEGAKCTVEYNVSGTIGGTVNNFIAFNVPIAPLRSTQHSPLVLTGGGYTTGLGIINATQIGFYKTPGFGNYVLGATAVSGMLCYEVAA